MNFPFFLNGQKPVGEKHLENLDFRNSAGGYRLRDILLISAQKKNHKKNLKADVFKIKMIYNFNAFLCLTWSEKFRSLTSRYQQNLEITCDLGGPQLKLTCTGHEPTPSTGICNIRSLVWKQFHIQLSLFLRFPVIYNNPTLCLP